MWPGGDADLEAPYMPPNVLTLDAIALGDTAGSDKKWAKGELSRLKIVDKASLLYDALATVGDPPALAPRSTWPTWYRTATTATLFARTRWDDRAIWFVGECARSFEDHHQPSAGNFALSRGHDNVIVDPSPYGSMSTLTTNAPTVASAQLPSTYIPSQGYWAEKTHWEWATQTRGGVVAARCNYADAYKFQDRKSDVPEAVRDFVLLPSDAGTDAALVVIDRDADTVTADHTSCICGSASRASSRSTRRAPRARRSAARTSRSAARAHRSWSSRRTRTASRTGSSAASAMQRASRSPTIAWRSPGPSRARST